MKAKRSQWPVNVYELGKEPDDDLSATTTPAQRLAMMWPLALEAWALMSKDLPDYDRANMPVVVVYRDLS